MRVTTGLRVSGPKDDAATFAIAQNMRGNVAAYGAVTDSLLIAQRTDEVIYVCRFNRAYKKHIRLYVKALRSGCNEVLGIVLNGLTPRRIEYYSDYRYYRSYKKYYGSQS